MENLQRDLEKDIKKYKDTKPMKRDRRRKLVFISEFGEIRSAGWVKVLAYFFAFLFIMAGAGTGGLYYLYQDAMQQNKQLQRELTGSKHELNLRKSDNANLQTRLTEPKKTKNIDTEDLNNVPKDEPTPPAKNDDIVESGKKESEVPITLDALDTKPDEADNTVERIDEQPSETAQMQIPRETEQEEPQEQQDKKEISDDVETADGPDESDVPNEMNPPAPIMAEDLQISQNRRTVNVEFNIRNNAPDADRISGHAIVVLKTGESDTENWVALPKVELMSGRPTGKDSGETFSIARFRTLTLKGKMDRVTQFKTATVFIFDRSGAILLEKNFKISSE